MTGIWAAASTIRCPRAVGLYALVLTFISALSWAAAPAAAEQQSIVSSSGDAVATLTYQRTGGASGGANYTDAQLRISRGGTSYYEAPVHSSGCPSECALEATAGNPLSFADLEGDGQPDLILRLNTGGAHCCGIVQIFTFDPGVMAFRKIERDFGDPGAKLVELGGNGQLAFVSGDDRFAYEFAPYAYSPLPLQIWQLQDGQFLDTTKNFPQQLTVDASKQFRLFLFNRRLGLGLGCLAAWAADEELLGHGRAVSALLVRELRRHNLHSRESLSPGGKAFVEKLGRFLKSTGYASR
jgi:hypothetical protein